MVVRKVHPIVNTLGLGWFIEDITSELLNVNGLWNTFRKGEENEKWNDQ